MSLLLGGRAAPACLALALALAFACREPPGTAARNERKAGPARMAAGEASRAAGEPETLSGHMYLRVANHRGLVKDQVESPRPRLLAADGESYFLPLGPRIMVIEPGTSQPRFISAPDGTSLRGIHGDELILQDREKGALYAIPKAGGEVRTIAARGFTPEFAHLVGERVVMIAGDSALSHVAIAGGPVETQLDQAGAHVLGDPSPAQDAIAWAVHGQRSMLLLARGDFESVEVVHELDDPEARITGVAWLGEDIVFAVGEPDMAFFRKTEAELERLPIDLVGDPVMWSEGGSVWWALHESNGSVAKAGRIGADGFHGLRNPPENLTPSLAGMTWWVEREGVTNYYIHGPAPVGARPLSIDLAELQPLSLTLANKYKGPKVRFEVTLSSGSGKVRKAVRESHERMVAVRARHCYEAALVRAPGLAGELELELELELERSLSKVAEVRAVGDELGEPDVVACIADVLRGFSILVESRRNLETLRATIEMSVAAR